VTLGVWRLALGLGVRRRGVSARLCTKHVGTRRRGEDVTYGPHVTVSHIDPLGPIGPIRSPPARPGKLAYAPNAKRQTPNAERRTPNALRSNDSAHDLLLRGPRENIGTDSGFAVFRFAKSGQAFRPTLFCYFDIPRLEKE
jgi:hypothetical protein